MLRLFSVDLSSVAKVTTATILTAAAATTTTQQNTYLVTVLIFFYSVNRIGSPQYELNWNIFEEDEDGETDNKYQW